MVQDVVIEPCGKRNDMDGSKSVKSLDGASPTPAEGESSDSDGDTEPAKSFHRRWSTNREINNSVRFRVFFFFGFNLRYQAAGNVIVQHVQSPKNYGGYPQYV